jgi:hypothetical protein
MSTLIGSDALAVGAPRRPLLADVLAAGLLPESALFSLGISGAVGYGVYVVAGKPANAVVLRLVGVPVAALAVAAVASVLVPRLSSVRAAIAALLGVAAFAIASWLVPFVMLDEKPFPFKPVDVLEEAALQLSTFGAMLLAALAVLRWPWIPFKRMVGRVASARES